MSVVWFHREDRVAKAGLDAIMREYAGDLSKAPSNSETKRERKERNKDSQKSSVKLPTDGPKDSVSGRIFNTLSSD